MKFNFSPVRSDDTLELHVQGDVLTINGEPYDFTPLEEGDSIPASAVESVWLLDPIRRENGMIEVTVRLPHGAEASEAARYPVPIYHDNGKVELPV